MGIFAGLGAVAVAVILLANAIGGLFNFEPVRHHQDRSLGTGGAEAAAQCVAPTPRRPASSRRPSTSRTTSNFVPSFIAGERAIFVGVGSVDAHVDFSQLTRTRSTVGEDGAVTVTLPTADARQGPTSIRPAATSPTATAVSSTASRGMFTDNPTSERELYLKAQHRVCKPRPRGSEMQVRAERNTEAMLQGLLGKLGFEQVNVVFVRHDPRRPATGLSAPHAELDHSTDSPSRHCADHEVLALQGAAVVATEAHQGVGPSGRRRQRLHPFEPTHDLVAGERVGPGDAFGQQPAHVVHAGRAGSAGVPGRRPRRSHERAVARVRRRTPCRCRSSRPSRCAHCGSW